MTILLYIIIGISVLVAKGYFLGGGKQAKKYGPARVFLHPIIRNLQNEYPKHEMITENDGRVKFRFYSTSFSFTTDFIYNPNHIQVSVAWDSIINKAHKVENCPYDHDAIERALNNAFEYFLTPSNYYAHNIKSSEIAQEIRASKAEINNTLAEVSSEYLDEIQDKNGKKLSTVNLIDSTARELKKKFEYPITGEWQYLNNMTEALKRGEIVACWDIDNELNVHSIFQVDSNNDSNCKITEMVRANRIIRWGNKSYIFTLPQMIEKKFRILNDLTNDKNNWPKSLKEAVSTLILLHTREEIDNFRKPNNWKEFQVQFSGMPMWIRNYFGLYRGNFKLMLDDNIISTDIEEISNEIAQKFWTETKV